jgi:hypothetical protein
VTTKDTAEFLAIKRKIENLTPANQLRLSAELIEHGQYAIAESIAGNVVAELTARRIFGKASDREGN